MATAHSDDVWAEIETRPWDEVVALQEERLREQVDYLARESDYYRRMFDEWDVDPDTIRTVEDLAEVPFTVKDDERANQTDPTPERPLGAHQAASRGDLARILSSSGTTGEPTFFGQTHADWEAWREMCARAVYAAGVRPDDVILHGVGRTMVPGGFPYVEALQHVGATVVPAGDGSTERILTTADKLSVDGLFVTTSHSQYLSDRAPEAIGKPVSDLGVDTIIGGGEPGMSNPAIRGAIRRAYDAERVGQVMGIGEVSSAVAGECEREQGMHFVGQGYVLMELIDPETGDQRPIEAGAEGELVYTPLGREATPLLRFRSGDYVEFLDTDCACGRTAPRFRIVGRTDDMLIYKAQNVYPAAIRDAVSDVDGATSRVKVVLPEPGKVQFDSPIPIEVVRDPDADRTDDAIAEAVERTVRERLNVRVAPRLVDREDVELSVYKTDLVRVEGGDG